MPRRRTQTPEGVPGFNCVKCASCGLVLYRKKAFAMPDGTFRCKKHKIDDETLFDLDSFNKSQY